MIKKFILVLIVSGPLLVNAKEAPQNTRPMQGFNENDSAKMCNMHFKGSSGDLTCEYVYKQTLETLSQEQRVLANRLQADMINDKKYCRTTNRSRKTTSDACFLLKIEVAKLVAAGDKIDCQTGLGAFARCTSEGDSFSLGTLTFIDASNIKNAVSRGKTWMCIPKGPPPFDLSCHKLKTKQDCVKQATCAWAIKPLPQHQPQDGHGVQ